MEAEDKRKLQRALELSEENNKMLKKLVRSMRWARLVRTIYFLIIIGASVGVFYYLEPILGQILATYGTFQESINNIKSAL
jgi:hypothetical protein